MSGLMIIYLTCIFGLFMLLLQFGLRYILGMETTAEAVFHRNNKAQKARIQEGILTSLGVLILIDSKINSSLLTISATIFFSFISLYLLFLHVYITLSQMNTG